MKAFLLSGVALCALAMPARADDAAIEKRLDAMQRRIDAQERQIAAQDAQIRSLHRALRKKGVPDDTMPTAVAAQPAPAQPTSEQLAQQNARIDALNAKFQAEDAARQAALAKPSEDAHVSVKNGRLAVQSGDGRFSLAVRALGQFDAAYYMQSARANGLANGADFSSGSNFRRAQLGIQGKLFGDWSYFFNTEFGGSNGTESGGRIQSLYVQYDGLKPLAFRIGAYPPSLGLEDNTSSSDTIFLERAGPSDIVRNAVGGDGRDAASITYAGDVFYGALSYTGGKVGDTAVFDEQQAVLGRLAASLWSDSHSRFVVSATGADMFRGPDATAGALAARNLTLSAAPELTVDSNGTKLVSTGAVDTENARFWGVEAGGNWGSLYGQAGYFGYQIMPRQIAPAPHAPDLNFNGWYAQATWILTGESRGYSTANGAFTAPTPNSEFSLSNGGWGAWELAGRYSDVDLNDRSGAFGLMTPFGGVRGGEQRIWTAGINWYPNSVLRFALDYQWIDVDRLSGSGAGIGQDLQALSLRSQISL